MNGMPRRKQKRRHRYHFSDERLRELLSVPVSLRLERLEEMNRFLDSMLTRKARRMRELLRQEKT
jgi:hypothetical protein